MGKRSEAQPILDRRDPDIHLPEHISAQSVRFAETWRSTSGNGASVRRANVTVIQGENVTTLDYRLRPLGGKAPAIARTASPKVKRTAFEAATAQAQSAREMAARDRALRIRRALESGPIARLVASGAMDAERAYTLASTLHDAGKLPGMADHTGSARK